VPKTEVLFPRRQGYAVGAALAMGYGVEAAAFAVRALPWVRVGATSCSRRARPSRRGRCVPCPSGCGHGAPRKG